MKRTEAGQEKVSEDTMQISQELRPVNVYRSSILDEDIEQIVGLSTDGEPIYVSKSYACVGESACVIKLPVGSLKQSLSADESYLTGLCNCGQTVFYQKSVYGELNEEPTFFTPSLRAVPSCTATLSSGGQRCIIVFGTDCLETIVVPDDHSFLPRSQCIASSDGHLRTFMLDASGLFYHVTFDTGDWYQVLADGEISQRQSLNQNETLLAADARRALFLSAVSNRLYLAQGAISFELPVVVESTEHLKVLWGENDMLYVQIGVTDLVPSLVAIQLSTAAILDTKFPSGVAPGTLREFQTLYSNGFTLVHNNGVYRLY